jgi:transcriptional regulator with XRE-family HTH domain
MKIILKAWRERRGLTQAELSRRSGVVQPVISEIETSDKPNPTIGTMWRLARTLRCAIDDLIEDDLSA